MDKFVKIVASLGGYIELDYNIWASYIGLSYEIWLYRIVKIIPMLFIMSIMIKILIVITTSPLALYKLYYTKIWGKCPTFKAWKPAQKAIALFWDVYGRIYYGYEVHGIENIPKDKSALIVYLHGVLPMDMFFFHAHLALKGRLIYAMVDRCLFRMVPGYPHISDIVSVIPATRESCIDILNTGNILTIAPDGPHESLFGDNYNLHWKNRIRFAEIALGAHTTVLPLFTENIQEAYRNAHYGKFKQFFVWIYRALNIPFRLIYGGFPVKLRTYIGQPIPYDRDTTPKKLKNQVMSAIYELRNKHQRLPGSIPHALIDRLRSKIK